MGNSNSLPTLYSKLRFLDQNCIKLMKNNEEIIRLTLGWPCLAKGQLILKANYGILDSSKK